MSMRRPEQGWSGTRPVSSSWRRRIGAAAVLLAISACGDAGADFSEVHGKWKWSGVGFHDECMELIAEFSSDRVRFWFLGEGIACWNIERVDADGVDWVLDVSSHPGRDGRPRCEATGPADLVQSNVTRVRVAHNRLSTDAAEVESPEPV